ncbi:von Willebrand factor-like [Rhipicephalus sanguineus]|uniref:von Willebrand factor-like n=1 Tax=Rhipicephalus sanguineus TaxID=34632 RepID=UPI001894C1CA|nr:von Willebrand factor-like [Rhipicephalus sanguineus]
MRLVAFAFLVTTVAHDANALTLPESTGRSAAGPGGCAPGEEYTCVSGDCGEKTCEDAADSNKICARTCITGCFCAPGLFRRSSDRRCVTKEQCLNTMLPMVADSGMR